MVFAHKDYLKKHLKRIHPNKLKNTSAFEQKNLGEKLVSTNDEIAMSFQTDSQIEPENIENVKSVENHSDKNAEYEQSKKDTKTIDTFAETIGKSPQTKIIKCESCGESFNSRFNLRKHKTTFHEGDKIFKCEECSCSFGQKLHLIIHVKRKHFDVSHESSGFMKSSKDKIEQNEKVDAFIVRSNSDQRESQDTEKLTQVNVLATDDPEISNSAEKKENSIEQVVEKNEEMKYKCRFCKEAFSEKSAVQKHIAVMHFEDIAIVDSNKGPLQNVNQRLKATDQVNNDIESTDTKLGKTNDKYCRVCQKYFYDKRNLKEHTDTMHLKIKNYKCEECSKSFGQLNTLKSHIQCVHEKLNKYKCHQCNKIFFYRHNLKQHISDVHLKLKSHKCNQCSKSFGHISNFKVHMKNVHEKLKRFECDQCQKSFSLRRSLKAHIECVHDKLKKFKCNHCSLSFGQSSTLNRHIECVHKKLKIFQCNQCSNSYGQSKNLILHIRKAHIKEKSS